MAEKKSKSISLDENPLDGPSPASDDPFIGKTIGNCRIIEKINEGGTAHIYHAYNEHFHLDRVVKILKPSLTDNEEFFTRFTREAQLTARLDHPNILRVFDTGQVNGYFYIEMEHISGQTLRSFMGANPRINERDILQIALQIARALVYAHHIEIKAPDGSLINGILHRDIKPENIMLLPDRTVKLMDFGAAKPLNLTSETMQGMIVGTFHYMSPEQIEGRELDVRSDFFSLGIVLYELFAGLKPFTGQNLTQLIGKLQKGKYVPLRKLRPSVSPLSEELIDELLSRSPTHRPDSAKQIVESLQVCINSHNAWGSGKKVRVPFSFRRVFPTVSVVFSSVALVLSALAFMQTTRNAQPVTVSESAPVSLLERGRESEHNGDFREAVDRYLLVPSVKDGGVANEYLEAQLRAAYLMFTNLNQFTRARSILEKLRMDYSDPAIDAYLGQIYFRIALYPEARDRLESALNSSKGSIIRQTPEFKETLLYYTAYSLDKQYTFVEKDPGLLREAIKAWNYFIEFAGCDNSEKENCTFAHSRLEELGQQDAKLNRDQSS